ncbi:hypothetical protein HDU96_007453 [Phlyctochytrium bullatum]|nr:hypothetical protein HDU96_007453 [Phlyctochytrium bullatum]
MRALELAVGLVVAALTLLPSATTALTLYEPPDGLAYLSAWVDTADPKDSPSGGDSPLKFNQRIERMASAFHVSQRIPLDTSPFDQSRLTANLSSLEETKSDAIMFLTIYPTQGLNLADADLTALADQLDAITNPVNGSSRRVMLRFAPEMNGNWFERWSMQPSAFKAAYMKLVTFIRRKTSRVAFVWSPNAANNYPFGGTIRNAELPALDTNGDGAVTLEDDPFTPYWPGADYVDWVGISLYWKGPFGNGFPAITNAEPPADLFEQMMQGSTSERVNPTFALYTNFCEKYNKPLVLSEGAAAFHISYQPQPNGPIVAIDPGPGQLGIERAFWRSFLTNPAFLTKYPKAKMFTLFEHYKPLEDAKDGAQGVNRDYRVSTDPAVLAAFKADLAGTGCGSVVVGAGDGGECGGDCAGAAAEAHGDGDDGGGHDDVDGGGRDDGGAGEDGCDDECGDGGEECGGESGGRRGGARDAGLGGVGGGGVSRER